jgi:hypothetical protein
MPARGLCDLKWAPDREFGSVLLVDPLSIGDILLCAIAIGLSILLFLITEKRKAAVGNASSVTRIDLQAAARWRSFSSDTSS